MKLENTPINYNDLIISFLSNNASKEEIDLLNAWIRQSEENKNEFIRLRMSWFASAQYQNCKTEELDAVLNNLNRKIEIRQKISSKRSSYVLSSTTKLAAGFLLMFLLGSLATFLIFKTNVSGYTADNTDNLMYIYAPKGSKAKTILQDGTTVWLNAGSNLMYNALTYGKTDRQVTLIGEGFFKVEENPDKPFIVNAKDLKITALGTEFNVKAYPDEDMVEATLVSGLVKISGENQNKLEFSFTLKPNQHVILPAGKASIDNITLTDPDKVEAKKLNKINLEKLSSIGTSSHSIINIKEPEIFTSWKDEKWIIKGETLGNLAISLERRYNINIDFTSEELKRYRFTGTFQNETVEQVMQILKLTAPLKYQIQKGEVTLILDPALKKKYAKYLNQN